MWKSLGQHPAVHECAVFGIPDDKWGEVGKAVISLRPGKALTKEQVLAFLGEKLAKYKIPRYIQFVEDVPKNNVGKIENARVISLYGKPQD